jgi:hypothetical protein
MIDKSKIGEIHLIELVFMKEIETGKFNRYDVLLQDSSGVVFYSHRHLCKLEAINEAIDILTQMKELEETK